MNLIEQLGGYAAAKVKFRDNGSLHAERLKSALLEYRRQNDIFEVGDWVIVGEDRVLAQFVGYAHKGTHAELPQININGQLYNSYFGAWKHATPEEIAAGRRL